MKVKLLHPAAKLPTRGSGQSAGLDLYSPYAYTIQPGETKLIKIEIATEFISGRVAIIKDRSSMAKKGIFTVGGVIDSDYRGPWGVLLHNSTDEPFFVACDDRVAQVVLVDCMLSEPIQVEELEDTDRGEGGFGSTGA